MIEIMNLDDNSLYVITVLFFLFGEGVVIYGFFLPKFLKGFKYHLTSSNSTNGKTNKLTPPQSMADVTSSGFDLKDLSVEN